VLPAIYLLWKRMSLPRAEPLVSETESRKASE
jgi:hypothetical protein